MKKVFKGFSVFLLTMFVLGIVGVMQVNAATAHSSTEAVQWAEAQIGQSLDYDGAYGAQCVDLVAYYYAYLGTTTPGGNAIDYASNQLPTGWSRVYGSYMAGDIIVWYANHSCSSCITGQNGHIAIVTSVNGSTLNVVDQNGPTNKGYCKANSYPSTAIKCAIRPDFGTSGGSTVAYTITNRDYLDLTDTSVTLRAMLDKSTTTMSECGVFIGTSTSNMTQIKETVSVGTTVQYMSYGTAKWYGTLMSGTTYYYQFYAIIGGTTYWGEVGSFTTTGMSPVPQGHLDAVSGKINKICFSGWAADWEEPSSALEIHVYLNGPAGTGTFLGSMRADQYRPDVNETYPYHGFSGEFYIEAEGFYSAYLYAINVGAGNENPLIGKAEYVLVYGDHTPPQISNVQVTNVIENGYTVSCTVIDDVGVSHVQFPTWKVSDTSADCTWYYGIQNGNTWTFTYTGAEAENEYLTHIYAYDNAGNYSSYAVPSVYVRKTDQQPVIQPENKPNSEPVSQTVYRIFGDNRYQTSYKIADALKTQLGIDKFQTVIIASGENFPDALAGSYLAEKKDAPILMINQKNAGNLTEYIKKNVKIGGRVYVLGGINAVPQKWLSDLGDYNLCRLEGENRYETNLMILDEAGVGNQEILVCTGKTFADSLSASATGMPILLVNNKTLSASQQLFLSAHAGNKFYIIGGTSAISDQMEAQIKKYGQTERIAGDNRYETSVKIAGKFFPGAKESILAYAKNYPDGLCGGPLAMSKNAPLILTATGKQDTAKAYMKAKGIGSGMVLGGDILISDDAVKEIYGISSIVIW